MNQQNRRSTISKIPRAAMGGSAAVLALLLLLLFPFGFGGEGSDEDAGSAEESSQGDTMVTSAPPRHSPLTGLAGDSHPPTLSDEEQKALSGDVLTVLVDEHSYLIEIPTAQESLYRPTPLPRIVELAQLADGDANGIRVRIVRRDTSRASAEEKLRLELQRGSIDDAAIYMSDTTVP